MATCAVDWLPGFLFQIQLTTDAHCDTSYEDVLINSWRFQAPVSLAIRDDHLGAELDRPGKLSGGPVNGSQQNTSSSLKLGSRVTGDHLGDVNALT